jgi:hypothetical protein
MAKDVIHDAVRNALVRDGWTITADPYLIQLEDVKLYADLAAERILAAERGQRKIVVEVKSFVGPSPVHDLEVALGQYEIYRGLLELTAPERVLYLAVTDVVYRDFFSRNVIHMLVQRFNVAMLVVNPQAEEIVTWTS